MSLTPVFRWPISQDIHALILGKAITGIPAFS
jgi:hypothetical protein